MKLVSSIGKLPPSALSAVDEMDTGYRLQTVLILQEDFIACSLSKTFK